MSWISVYFREPEREEHILIYSESLEKVLFGRKQHVCYTKSDYDFRVTDGENWYNIPLDDVDYYQRKPLEPTSKSDNNGWISGRPKSGANLCFVFRRGGANGDRVLVKNLNGRLGSEIGFNSLYFYWGVVADGSSITHWMPLPEPPTPSRGIQMEEG